MPDSRRSFLKSLVVAGAAVKSAVARAADAPAAPSPEVLRFFVVGDWGRRGNGVQQATAAAMAAEARTAPPRFIVSTGDNFYESGVESVTDSHWSESFHKVYDRDGLRVPWVATLGNHDYRGEPQAQVEYGKQHADWVMPSRYFTLARPTGTPVDVELFCLDTSPLLPGYRKSKEYEERVRDQDPEAQWTWLANALAASRARWKIVVGHHPVFSGGQHGDTPELIKRLKPLLEEHKVPAYVCGHDHDLQHIVSGGVNYLVSGAGSNTRPPVKHREGRFCSGANGFLVVEIDGNAWRGRFVDVKGTTVHAFTG
jgi:acid phosphatase